MLYLITGPSPVSPCPLAGFQASHCMVTDVDVRLSDIKEGDDANVGRTVETN